MRTNHARTGEVRVLEILDGYLADLRAGRAPDPEALLARHPDVAESLAASLRALDFVHDAGRTLEAPEPSSGREEPASAGRTLGDYRLLREIARGGMAVVYEAEQVSLGRRVALKVLPFAAVLDAKQIQRFKNEAHAAAQLQHPHIVPVHAVGCERGVHFYAMQYIEGQSLAVAVREMREMRTGTGPRSTEDPKPGSTGAGSKTPISSHGSVREPAYIRMAAQLGVQAAVALDHAHQLGIVHRDVKPGNLLVDLAGTLWVTDFGLACSHTDVGLTMTGELLGTFRYMSPEQALAKRVPIDHRTDVYSLGATLYELFTLEPAFPGDDPHAVLQAVASTEPVPPRRLNPALPRDLETVILKAMAKEPAGRYATAQEMADDLGRFLENRPIEARRPGAVRRAAKWARRHRVLVGAATGVLLLAMAGLATGTALLWREKEQTRTAFVRAEANLALALKALDQIYMGEAYDHPQIREGLPRDLLERGLGFYTEFARENAHSGGMARLQADILHSTSWILRRLGKKEQASAPLDRAIATYRELIGQYPEDPSLRLRLSFMLDNGKGDVDGAVTELLRAIQIRPDYAEARYDLGNLRHRMGDLDGAIARFREAIRIRPDFTGAHINLGISLKAKRDLDGAIAELREAIKLQPGSAQAHTNLALTLHERGDDDGAIAEFQEAIRVDPTYSDAHNSLGAALFEKGEVDGAIREYREAIRLTPDSHDSHHNLGMALYEKRDFEGATLEFLEALRLKPEDASSKEWVEDAERMAELEVHLDRMLSGELRPRDAFDRIALAELLYAKSRHADSARMYGEAFAQDAALMDDLLKGHRYNAACSASLAAGGGRADGAEWRGRALGWLRADLAAREKAPAELGATLEHWKKDPDLAGVRDRPSDLPEPEREAWQGLWAAVDAALASARQAPR